ncbi:MAG: VOC family protein [Eubacterium sp.]|nr:VOC family protein [Eubacterium sp.]
MASIINVAHTGFIVADIEKQVAFWTEVMGGELLKSGDAAGPVIAHGVLGLDGEASMKTAVVKAGGHELEFFQFTDPVSAEYHGDMSVSGSAHVAMWVDNLEEMYRDLTARGIRFHSEINTDYKEDGSVDFKWVYMRDPNNICIELMEAGK